MRETRARSRRTNPPPRRRGCGCLPLLASILTMLLGCMIGYLLAARTPVSQSLGEQLSVRLGATPAVPPANPSLPDPQAVQQQAAGLLPTAVAAVPDGTLIVHEGAANAYLHANRARFAPADQITVQFVPGTIRATVMLGGTSVQGSTEIAVQDGLPVLVNPRLDGMLGALLDTDQLAAPLQQLLHDQLIAQGRRVTDARIEQGQIVLTVERQF